MEPNDHVPRSGWQVPPAFDLDAFLAQPLVARVAPVGAGVRPVWYLWQDDAFWWLTGAWSRLTDILRRDPRVSLVVDSCDLATGRVLQVTARGSAEVVPVDGSLARRRLVRYLGPDEETWDDFLKERALRDPTAHFVRLAPSSLVAQDLSFRPGRRAPAQRC